MNRNFQYPDEQRNHFRIGPKPDFPPLLHNVRCWGKSGSRSGAPEGPLIAEGVEELGPIEKQATFGQASFILDIMIQWDAAF